MRKIIKGVYRVPRKTVYRNRNILTFEYSDSLRAGRSGDLIPVGARFSAPVQTGSGTNPWPVWTGTGSSPGGKTAETQPLLMDRLKKE